MKGVRWGEVTERHDSIVIICSGSSLKGFNLNTVSSLGYVICVNGSYSGISKFDAWFTLDPWGLGADQMPKSRNVALFAAVPQDFGTIHSRIPQHRINAPTNVTYLNRLMSHNNPSVSSETAYRLGLSTDKGCINTGNSGFGALNLAYHMEPRKILILGMDGNIGYYYTEAKKNRALKFLPEMICSAKLQLDEAGITVINGSINSTIECFPKYEITQAIEEFKNV